MVEVEFRSAVTRRADMKRHRTGCSVGSKLGAVILSMVFGGHTLLAQAPGTWVGTTSRGGQMQFTVNPDGTIAPYQSEFLMTCESGTQFQSRLTVFGPPVPITDQSFDGGVPPRESGGIAFEFAGAFSSDTEASGGFSFILPAFRILDDGFTSQICQDGVDWSAVWQGPAAPQPGTGSSLSPGDQVTTFSDGNVSAQLVRRASDRHPPE
jgi:hypothetical protein